MPASQGVDRVRRLEGLCRSIQKYSCISVGLNTERGLPSPLCTLPMHIYYSADIFVYSLRGRGLCPPPLLETIIRQEQ